MDPDDQTFPEKMLFDSNLQEFANRVGLICGLETGGKISQGQAYERIKELWKKLKESKKNLHVADESDPRAT